MNKTVHMIDVPAKQIPSFRYKLAKDAEIKKIMLTTWGGLGDQVCAEPTLRHAFKVFPDYEISLLTSFPELFTHLPFREVYSKEQAEDLNDDDWLVLHTYYPQNNMINDFLAHNFTNCVDFASLAALQRQLPIADRQIRLPGYSFSPSVKFKDARILVHPGRSWPSKTFPKAWWDEVLSKLCSVYSGVAIIGKDVSEEIGVIDVDVPKNCLDLRNKLSLTELVEVIKQATVIVTNDSAPLHIAASGNGHILYLATCKHPDFITHYRYNRFGWRMRNLSRDGLWNHSSESPVREEPLDLAVLPPGLMERCLPSPLLVHTEVTRALHLEGG